MGLGDPQRSAPSREAYAKQNVEQYKLIVTGIARTLFDRDTAPGAEPEDLLRLDIPALVVPGRDASHATSAARYLEECLPSSEYWDVPVAGADRRADHRPGCRISSSGPPWRHTRHDPEKLEPAFRNGRAQM